MSETDDLRGLEAIIEMGAGLRRQSYSGLLKSATPSAVSAFFVSAGIYVLVMVVAGRSDWANIVGVSLAVALIPLLAVSLLVLGGRRTHPFTLSLIVTAFSASLIVAVVSALRIPISYGGVLLTLPSSACLVCLANVTMSRAVRKSVALLNFPGADAVASAAPWPIPIVDPQDVDIHLKRILIDPASHHSPDWTPTLARLYLRGHSIEAWPSYLEGALGKVDLSSFDLADVSYSSSQVLYYKIKRTLDILGVLVLALPVAVICSVIGIYIYLLDGWPAIFVQSRRGYGGSVFSLYKFRTMYKNSDGQSTSIDDIRIIPGCNFLRKSRLDELPQLINILIGDMSFIGPRPVSVSVAESLEARNPIYFNRQILQPGLTGWAQVSHGYAQTEDEEMEKLAFDLYYLKHVSFDLDIIIVFRTVSTILMRVGSR